MKIEIPDSLRVGIDTAVAKTTASADAVRATRLRLDEIESEQEKSLGKALAIGAIEIPNEKQITELIVAEKRRDLLGQRLMKLGNEIETQKTALVRDIGEANELFRRSASKPLAEEMKRQLIESLPPSVKSNDHLIVSIWAGSVEIRALGAFLNSPLPSHRDDAETILAAADRILILLRDLLAGNDISAVAAAGVAA